MNIKKFITRVLPLSLIAPLFFASCDKQNQEQFPTDQVDVSVEEYFLEETGELTPISTDLRAVTGTGTHKGTITGDGLYDYNAKVTISATAKPEYRVHKFYEKSGLGGYTEAKGVVNKPSHSVTFNITQNMVFKVIYSSNSDSKEKGIGYQNLVLGSSDLTLNGKDWRTQTTAKCEQLQAFYDPSGNFVEWVVSNPNYKDLDLGTPSEKWLTANNSNGTIVFTASEYISKGAARKATVKVFKNGTPSTLGKNVSSVVTVTQNSYFEEVDPAGKITFGDGTIADIPASLSTAIPAKGGSQDLKTLHKSLNSPMTILVPTYVNGVKQPESKWVKKNVTLTWGNPSATWLTRKGTVVSAGENSGTATRRSNVVVTFKCDGVTLKTTTIAVSQGKNQVGVDVETE